MNESAALTTDPPALRVLAIDDDADFREFIEAMLLELGHEAKAVASPRALFEAIEASMPDVVLLDIKMGKHSGEDVLAQIRERWQKLCVIVVTGYPSLETMRETFKKDAFDYLAKPFSRDDLRHTLAQAADALNLGGSGADRLRRELGRRIRIARTERGWTLKELSERSGVSVSQLSSIERGTHLPSIESLLVVAESLEARPSAWLGAAGF